MTAIPTSPGSARSEQIVEALIEASKDLAAESRFQSASELMLLAAAMLKAYAGDRVSLASADVDALALSLAQLDATQNGWPLAPDVSLDSLEGGATYRIFVRALLIHLASSGMSAGWKAPEDNPSVEPGEESCFYVAVRRQHNDQVFVFPALFCNGTRLEDHRPVSTNGPHWEMRAIDDETVQAFGWFHIVTGDEDDDGGFYRPICGAGDVVVGWHERPAYRALDIGPTVRVKGAMTH